MDAERGAVRHDGAAAADWATAAGQLGRELLVKHGLDVGGVDIALAVRPVEGLVRQLDGSVEKRFSKKALLYPLQARALPCALPYAQGPGAPAGRQHGEALLQEGAAVPAPGARRAPGPEPHPMPYPTPSPARRPCLWRSCAALPAAPAKLGRAPRARGHPARRYRMPMADQHVAHLTCTWRICWKSARALVPPVGVSHGCAERCRTDRAAWEG